MSKPTIFPHSLLRRDPRRTLKPRCELPGFFIMRGLQDGEWSIPMLHWCQFYPNSKNLTPRSAAGLFTQTILIWRPDYDWACHSSSEATRYPFHDGLQKKAFADPVRSWDVWHPWEERARLMFVVLRETHQDAVAIVFWSRQEPWQNHTRVNRPKTRQFLALQRNWWAGFVQVFLTLARDFFAPWAYWGRLIYRHLSGHKNRFRDHILAGSGSVLERWLKIWFVPT